MNSTAPLVQSAATHELRFQSLFNEERGYAFPCDALGHVDMDALNCKALQNYLFARAVVGRELFLPQITACLPERRLAAGF